MDRDQRAEGGLAALDLLADQRLAHVVETGAAVLDRDRRAEQAELGHPLDDAHVEVMVDVVLLGHRQHPPVDELAHRLGDRALLIGQLEVHARSSPPFLGDHPNRRAVTRSSAGHAPAWPRTWRVRGAEELLRDDAVDRAHGHAEARAEPFVSARERAVIASATRSTAARGLVLAGLGQEQRELVAADPKGGVGRAKRALKHAADHLERGVAGGVAVSVVQRLEAVQVAEDERHRVAVPNGPRRPPLEPLR